MRAPVFRRFWLVPEGFRGPQNKLHSKVFIIEELSVRICLVSCTPVLSLLICIQHFPPELVHSWYGHLCCPCSFWTLHGLLAASEYDLQRRFIVTAALGSLRRVTLLSAKVLERFTTFEAAR